MVKKILCMVTALLFVLFTGCGVFSGTTEQSARIITIFKNEGSQIRMTKGSGQEYEAKEGLKLYEGYTLSTGAESYSHLKLDEKSVVKTDENSKLEVTRLNEKNLALNLISGALSVDAAPQKDGDTLEVGADNCALAVRGTLFVAETSGSDASSISMLHGLGVIEGTELSSGYSIAISGGSVSGKPEKIVIDENMSLFLLKTILENKDLLLAEGVFSQEDIDSIPGLIKLKQKPKASSQSSTSVPVPSQAEETRSAESTAAVSTAQTVSSAAENNAPAPAASTITSASTSAASSRAASSKAASRSSSSSKPKPASSSSSSSRKPASSSSSKVPSSSSSTSRSASSSGSGPIAKIGDTGYDKISDAINNAGNSDVIEILENCYIDTSENVIMRSGVQLKVAASRMLIVDGHFTVNTSANLVVENNAVFAVNNGGVFDNNGILTVHGTLRNHKYGKLTNNLTGRIGIESDGSFTNDSIIPSGLDNSGDISIKSNSEMVNNGNFQNDGTLSANNNAAIQFNLTSVNSGTGFANQFTSIGGTTVSPSSLAGNLFYYNSGGFTQAAASITDSNDQPEFFTSAQDAFAAMTAGTTVTVHSATNMTASTAAGAKIIVAPYGKLNVASQASNNSDIVVQGKFEVSDTLLSTGSINIESAGELSIETNGSLAAAGGINNNGSIYNKSRTLTGLSISGPAGNIGQIHNTGTMSSSGTFTNSGVLTSSGSYTCKGPFINLNSIDVVGGQCSLKNTLDLRNGTVAFTKGSFDLSSLIINTPDNNNSKIQFGSNASISTFQNQFTNSSGTAISAPEDISGSVFKWNSGTGKWQAVS